MSNYIPRTRKKRERQERLEHELRRLIDGGASMENLVIAAEEVRLARIRTIRADRQHCCIIGSTDRYDAKIASLQATRIEVILAEFGWQQEPEAGS